MEFRLLRADEIDCRISICNQYGVGLLLYKDARCDQNILDETVGPMNWQRHHSRDNANCIVSLWDNEKKQWIEKEDTGKESFTEAEKGLASDSFKRACFNWGIGRELYTAPDMWVGSKDLKTLKEVEGYQGKKKWECKDSFRVLEIEYQDKKITSVKIQNVKNNTEIVFGMPASEAKKQEEVAKQYIDSAKVAALEARCKKDGVSPDKICTLFKVKDFTWLTERQFRSIFDNWDDKLRE